MNKSTNDIKDNDANAMLGDVLVFDVPNGSYNFSITEWDDLSLERRVEQ